jgi:hypothetical protein
MRHPEVRRNAVLVLLAIGGLFVSYTAAAASQADNEIPAEIMNQPGQAEADAEGQVGVTGTTPEEAARDIAEKIAEFERLIPESEDDAMRSRRTKVVADLQSMLEQLCRQLAADGVTPAPC